MGDETEAAEQTAGGRPVAFVDRTLEPLVDRYVGCRRADVVAIREDLDSGDLDDVRVRGHSMKGSGGGYGFDEVTEIGAALEAAAAAGDADAILGLSGRLERYIDTVEVRYVDE